MIISTYLYRMKEGTAFDNFNPMVWRFGAKDKEKGMYMALTDSPSAMRFNISDLSTMGKIFIQILHVKDFFQTDRVIFL